MAKRLGVVRWPIVALLLCGFVFGLAYWGVPEGHTQGGRLFTGQVETFPAELEQAVQQGERAERAQREGYEAFARLWQQQALSLEVEQRVATLSVAMARVAGLSRAYFRLWYTSLLYYMEHTELQGQLSTLLTLSLIHI